MKKIKLSKGKFALVDDENFEWLNQFKWHYDGFYARSLIKGKKIRMHRFIMGNPKGKQIDHKNHDKLDYTRRNLRIASYSQNNMNKEKINNKWGYKGISFYNNRKYYKKRINNLPKPTKSWVARIKVDRKIIHLGSFLTVQEAALAYNNGAIKYFGEFASLNKI